MAFDAHFCPNCGHQNLVFKDCTNCGKHLAVNAKFCSRCGQRADKAPAPVSCGKCGVENLPDARFCNSCGERL